MLLAIVSVVGTMFFVITYLQSVLDSRHWWPERRSCRSAWWPL